MCFLGLGATRMAFLFACLSILKRLPSKTHKINQSVLLLTHTQRACFPLFPRGRPNYAGAVGDAGDTGDAAPGDADGLFASVFALGAPLGVAPGQSPWDGSLGNAWRYSFSEWATFLALQKPEGFRSVLGESFF